MQNLLPTQLMEFLGTEPQAVLLDVRQDWELLLGQIKPPGARTLDIDMPELPRRLSEIDDTQPIVCICHHGVRSAQAVAFLERQGFERVYNLDGGIDAWSLEVDPGVPRY
jgi:rhodanese-related sulfurtransferase